MALLAGALVGSFGTMTTLRLKLADLDDDALAPERDLLEESLSHLLLATLVAATDAVALVIGTNTAGAAGAVNRGTGFSDHPG